MLLKGFDEEKFDLWRVESNVVGVRSNQVSNSAST
jgi:hypothetical protein